MSGILPWLLTVLGGYPPTLVVPRANRSIEVIGKPDSGKTFSVINPLLISAIDQGFPILLYDYKGGPDGVGGQIPYIATYAARHGYKVRIFAPGRDYSCTINPLDFIEDSSDMTTAQTLAKTFQQNLRGNTGSSDGFFGPAGQRLIYAIFQLAKSSRYPDLAMAFAILQLSELPQRLVHAGKENFAHFPTWVRMGFTQLMQVADADRTSGGILAGAADLITEFMQKNLLPCYLGASNTSLYLEGKEILIFQSNILRQKVVNPLIASIINILINLNFSKQREVPLICSFDELPTLIIEDLPTWANEHRSKGYVGIYGYQSIEQPEKGYGKEGTGILRSALGSRFWFNPGNENTAGIFSTYLGEQDIVIKNKSVSRNWGNPGGQRSTNETLQTVPLIRPDDITSFLQGECIFVNEDYKQETGNLRRGNLPWHLRQIRIPKRDQKTEEECEKLWGQVVLPKLRERELKRRTELDLEVEIRKRLNLAERLLPLAKKEGNPSASPVHPAFAEDGGSYAVDF